MLRIAVQSKGRLFDDTMNLLDEADIKVSSNKRTLLVQSSNFPLEVLYLRDDDIPQSVATGVADIGVVGENEFAEKNEKDLPDNHITINQIDLNNWEYDDDSNCKPVAYEINLTFCNEEYTMYFTVKDLQRYEDGWDLENSGCEGSTLYFDSVNKYFENYPNEADRLTMLMKECWDDFYNTENSPYNYMGIKE